MLLLWVYAVVWFAALAAISFFWPASWWIKAVPLILLVVASPDSLLTTYDEYKTL